MASMSQHMTLRLYLLINLENIISSPFNIPNCNKTLAIKGALVVLGLEFVVNNVLCVPHLYCIFNFYGAVSLYKATPDDIQ